ncbi:type I-F CRISPR-associated helicase Cas3f [Salinisphaera orenii]|uniref:type I-F CRISPR-associated helicase Cas3f n=1 Tax=Salinisphaera orenii TaxID=856731 RepID=UPI000DBE79F9
MNILLVSQCRKNALKETRRILDQFAERRGERTWQTPITKAGLDTLRKLLRKTARKNTAVACHWIRGANHSELLWIVGDGSQFNLHGTVPTNTTKNDVLRRADENDWHTLADIHLLAALAALFHDFGKACQAFQDKLAGKRAGRNRYRHEWISLRLLQAFVGKDDDATWLARLQDADTIDETAWLAALRRDGLDEREPLPLAVLPPLARAVGWLIISHHRLPTHPTFKDNEQLPFGKKAGINAATLPPLPDQIDAAWNEIVPTADAKLDKPYWHFPSGLPLRSDAWRRRARRTARQTLERLPHMQADWLEHTYVMHVARLCLMLADHYYSSLNSHAAVTSTLGDHGFALYANTDKHGAPAQPLDDHLLGVTRTTGEIAHRLPDMVAALPRIARHKGFRRRSRKRAFRWQDRAFDLAASIRERSDTQGFFGVNMASTGYGKTLANGRILYALANPERGARFTVALGLRTLTLQTGDAYAQHMGLGVDDLAVCVGGQANRELYAERQAELDASGSSSIANLLDDESYVRFEGAIDEHPLLSKVVTSPQARKLIAAPVAVCTIDHLMPASESLRGGSQIAPMLRLMGADLVLDEPDDFGMDDLPALTRLVYWAGLLGSRVLLSSATLAPALVEGLFDAYRAGRTEFQNNRGVPDQPINICCAWFDEFGCEQHDCAERSTFAQRHEYFTDQRAQKLATAETRRRGEIVPVDLQTAQKSEALRADLAGIIHQKALALHAHHCETDPHSDKRVSFGLVRMANINALVDIARALYALDAPVGTHIHLCVYHSQFSLLVRSRLEQVLDTVLDRRGEQAVFDNPATRAALDAYDESEQVFIVLGSPVTEVGRDHDYDWAVVEPSSMRSIIQLAGRVRRHRNGSVDQPNVALLDTNLKALEHPDRAAFHRPGFESDGEYRLSTHRLSELLETHEYDPIDACPRLLARDPLDPVRRLADLEHRRIRDALIPAPTSNRRRRGGSSIPKLAAYSVHISPTLLTTGILAQEQRFREQTRVQVDLVLLPNEDDTDYVLMQREIDRGGKVTEATIETRNHRLSDDTLAAKRISPWATRDYMSLKACITLIT